MTRTFNEGVNRFSTSEEPALRPTYTLHFLEDLIPYLRSLAERGYLPVPERSHGSTLRYEHPLTHHAYWISAVTLTDEEEEE